MMIDHTYPAFFHCAFEAFEFVRRIVGRPAWYFRAYLWGLSLTESDLKYISTGACIYGRIAHKSVSTVSKAHERLMK